MNQLLDDILAGTPIAPSRLEEALHGIMAGESNDAQIAGLLVALRTRPPDGATLAAMARVLRQHCTPVTCDARALVDTCGTGGDGSGTFNISTSAGLVVAACGGAVAKHGNRSVSSRSGSADVLEAVGVQIDLPPQRAEAMLESVGFTFLFAPRYHPAMASVMPARRALGIRTHFNLLGPLSNPAQARYQLLGVSAPELTQPMAEALRELGTHAALVVHCEGTDEIGLHGTTAGHLLHSGEVREWSVDPVALGCERAPLSALAGGDARENAEILEAVLNGESGPRSTIVALNAGAACWIAGLTPTLTEGVELARSALADGRAAATLEQVTRESHADAGHEP